MDAMSVTGSGGQVPLGTGDNVVINAGRRAQVQMRAAPENQVDGPPDDTDRLPITEDLFADQRRPRAVAGVRRSLL
jgi:hypothetical protein